MYNRTFLFLICFFSFLQPAAAGGMFKCKDSNGTIIFSDRKCSDNAEKIEVKAKTPESHATAMGSHKSPHSTSPTAGVPAGTEVKTYTQGQPGR